jgi:hypothetical protein
MSAAYSAYLFRFGLILRNYKISKLTACLPVLLKLLSQVQMPILRLTGQI